MTTAADRGEETAVVPGAGWHVGLSFAMVFGVAEVVGLTLQRYGLSSIIHRPRFYTWMTPASYVIIMTFVVFVVWAVTLLWNRAGHRRVLVVALAFAGIASNLLALVPRLHPIAITACALSSGIMLERFLGVRRRWFDRFVRVSARLLTVSVVALGVTHHAFARWGRTWPEGTSAAGQRPNILLIILDTVRGASMSLYGYDRPTTPNLERLATRGVTFDRAVSPSSWTLPAHASMFTGQHPGALSANWLVPLDDTYPTLAEVLAESGYRTAGFVANREFGTYEHGLARGFSHYEDYRFGLADIFLSSGLGYALERADRWRAIVRTDALLGLKRAERVVDDFLDWLDPGGDQPFFAFLNLFDAHDPYLPPDPWFTKFDSTRSSRLVAYKRHDATQVPQSVVRSEQAAYDGAIAYLDHEVGRLVDTLTARGLDHNTIVIITSDHGEEFGRFGLLRHGHSLYPDQLFVPWLIVHPGSVPAGVRVPAPVSLRDLGPTVFDLVEIPIPPTFEGRSAAAMWSTVLPEGETHSIISEVRRFSRGGPSSYPTSHGDMRSVLEGYTQVITHELGIVESFDWSVPGFPRWAPPEMATVGTADARPAGH